MQHLALDFENAFSECHRISRLTRLVYLDVQPSNAAQYLQRSSHIRALVVPSPVYGSLPRHLPLECLSLSAYGPSPDDARQRLFNVRHLELTGSNNRHWSGNLVPSLSPLTRLETLSIGHIRVEYLDLPMSIRALRLDHPSLTEGFSFGTLCRYTNLQSIEIVGVNQHRPNRPNPWITLLLLPSLPHAYCCQQLISTLTKGYKPPLPQLFRDWYHARRHGDRVAELNWRMHAKDYSVVRFNLQQLD